MVFLRITIDQNHSQNGPTRYPRILSVYEKRLILKLKLFSRQKWFIPKSGTLTKSDLPSPQVHFVDMPKRLDIIRRL